MSDAPAAATATLAAAPNHLTARLTAGTTGTINNIQCLRAYAALAVVVLHAGYPKIFGIEFGAFGVDVFFAISGYIMTQICETDPRHFLTRRIARIVPMYWLTTLALFAIAVVKPSVLNTTTTDVASLVKSLLFIPYEKSEGHIWPVLFVGWTLNYEMYFYLLISAALLWTPRHATLVASALIVAILAALTAAGADSAPARFYSDPIVLEFVMGVAVWYAVNRPAMRDRFGLAAVLLAISAMVLLPPLNAFYGEHDLRAIRLGIPAALLVAAAVQAEQSGLSLRSRRLLLIGDASYVLYLTHSYVVHFFMEVGRRLPLLYPSRLIGAVIVISLAVALSIAIHRRIERPVSSWLRVRLGA